MNPDRSAHWSFMGTKTDWQVGDVVAYYSRSTAGKSKVVRAGKRDVVLENGFRFNRNTGSVSISSYDSRTFTTPDDPVFISRYRALVESSLRGRVSALADEFRLSPSVDAADRVIEAVTEWKKSQG